MSDSSTSTKQIRVLCVDDHAVVREGIARILARQADMRLVGSVPSAEEGVELYAKRRPDVTLMDLQLRGMSGVDAIRRVLEIDAHARVIVFTVSQGSEDIYRALEAGAVTFLFKDMLSRELVRVIRQVHAGRQPLPPAAQLKLEERATHATLTRREVQVVELLARGMSNWQIAAAVGISHGTVASHVKHVLRKLEVQDRTAAVNVALRRGIIHIS